MLYKLIYEYFKLNTLSSYCKCEFNARKLISNEVLLEDTLANFIFKDEWYKKLNKKIKHHHFDFSITSIDNLSNLYRIHVNRNRVFSYNISSKVFHKSNNEKFIFLISQKNNKYYINTVVYKEENPIFYETLSTSSLENISSSRNSGEYLWNQRVNNLNILYNGYTILKNSLSSNNISSITEIKDTRNSQTQLYKSNIQIHSTLINGEKLIKYARTYALKYNKNYTNFNNSGGDCTNFVSQALNFAGLNQTHNWKPYTASWIMVIPFRDYIVKNNFAIEFQELCPNPIGTIIQFFSPIKERFSHTGIITDMMDDGELLYCCHDYDKLDFPLSETYPIFYKRIRNLQIK
ncbi:amidase domain-containing protein [Clostridium gasigenes]|uniref:Amidase domain-containing protein n=1 Tax=Clostridium gasigenes TaxID=94869 RepID=A0A7X0SEB0_9CLOT|nr:amidase domain-containing protein [Clostridium gasigenes]MBB6716061.1 amidase domain-containing protein [Clostridium gasigenes]